MKMAAGTATLPRGAATSVERAALAGGTRAGRVLDRHL